MTDITQLPGLPEPATATAVPSRALPGWAAPAALAAILALATGLYGWALGSLGWGNTFYTAAVKSMGESWTNFLFGSFDPAGVITVDKPPAALWPQVISTQIFGMHGWAVILPQVVEGVAAVFLLHRTVRRWAGEGAGLLAALVLTLTPITVAINRDNNPDTLLVLALVAAAYALTRALQATTERAMLWWLCGSGFLIGFGFLTKMMAAWMVVPAFAAAWLIGAGGTWLARLWRLTVAGGVLAVSSLWWVAMVALWPGDHPYIGGSTDGSAWNLVVGYNGLGRVFGQSDTQGGGLGGGVSFGGSAGFGRLFNSQVGGQISWLLPLCAVALVVAGAVEVLRRRGVVSAGEPLAAAGWALWGLWLLVCAAVFATQKGIFHPYYTTQLAPAVAALTAGFVVALTRAHRAGARWAVPVGAGAVAVTAIWAFVLIRRVPSWHGWLAWLVVAAGVGAVALLLAAGLRSRLLPVALGGAVLSVVLAPGAWAISVPGSHSAMGGATPSAGPFSIGSFGGGAGRGGSLPKGFQLPEGFELPEGFQLPEGMELPGGLGGMPSGGASGMPSGGTPAMPSSGATTGSGAFPGGMGGFGGGATLTAEQRKVLDYAVANSGSARIKLAVEGGSNAAAPFILGSDATVIGMGGFLGTDNAPTVNQLERWTGSGQLRYVLGSDGGGSTAGLMGGGSGGTATRRANWVSSHCTKVPASAYGGTTTSTTSGNTGMAGMMGAGSTLYDCASQH